MTPTPSASSMHKSSACSYQEALREDCRFSYCFKKTKHKFSWPCNVIVMCVARENDLTFSLSPRLWEEPSFHTDMDFTRGGGGTDNYANSVALSCGCKGNVMLEQD